MRTLFETTNLGVVVIVAVMWVICYFILRFIQCIENIYYLNYVRTGLTLSDIVKYYIKEFYSKIENTKKYKNKKRGKKSK